MSRPRVRPEGDIDLLTATPDAATAGNAARVQPARADAPAHDAFTRLLHRLEPGPEALSQEARPQADLASGALVLDDAVLDQPCARHIDLVGSHSSGQHKRVVQGADLVSLVWTDGDRIAPCDNRSYYDAKTATKNDHFRAMIVAAGARLSARCLPFDGWYARLENLKPLRALGRGWLTRLKANRLVNQGR